MRVCCTAGFIVGLWIAVPSVTPAAPPSTVPATRPAAAADVYVAASKLCTVDGPSNSATYVGTDPPYSPEWFGLAEKAYHSNAAARAMVHGLPPPPLGRWADASKSDIPALNHTRHIANEIRDASTYAFLQGRTSEAFDLLDDLTTMSQLLRSQPAEEGAMIRLLVGIGIDAMRSNRLVALAPQLKIVDAVGLEGIRRARVTALIAALIQQRPLQAELDALGDRPEQKPVPEMAGAEKRIRETINRWNADKTLAAMSLACQLYYADQGTWPEQAADLVPGYLPLIPIDPWGDGKQTFGYVLVAKGRPDGADRPLVFDRCESSDGLSFTTTRPLYDFYTGDGSNDPENQRRHLGQYRDVSAWTAP